jgi:hypothetical protein
LKIRLCFPIDGAKAIKSLGLRQPNPETLRLVTDHPMSRHGQGVLLRGKSGDPLDAPSFAVLQANFGAWVEVDSYATKERVISALGLTNPDFEDLANHVKTVAGVTYEK